jgi:hypothetical protein
MNTRSSTHSASGSASGCALSGSKASVAGSAPSVIIGAQRQPATAGSISIRPMCPTRLGGIDPARWRDLGRCRGYQGHRTQSHGAPCGRACPSGPQASMAVVGLLARRSVRVEPHRPHRRPARCNLVRTLWPPHGGRCAAGNADAACQGDGIARRAGQLHA